MSISFRFENLSEVQTFHLDLMARMNAVFVETAHALVQEAAKTAREQVRSDSIKPRGRSGRYLQSIHAELQANPFQIIGKVASDHPQAAVLEFGSRPHVIQARSKKTLFWPGARFPVKEVNHPGTPAFRVLGGAIENAVESTEVILNQTLHNKLG